MLFILAITNKKMRLNIDFLIKILNEFQDKTELESSDIIRIEKKINLESKLNKSENVDENQQIISLLKNNFRVLKLIQNYTPILEILSNQKISHKNIYDFIPSEIEEIETCIETYFGENLKDYFTIHFKQNKYKELNSFANYIHILPGYLILFIQETIAAHLDNLIALLKSKSKLDKKTKQLSGILNKDFYALLNSYHSYEFEERIFEIVNITANKHNDYSYKVNHKMYLHIMVALKKFESWDESLAETIHNNYDFAEEKTRTIVDKLKNLRNNKFVWFICAVWIFGFLIDNGNSRKEYINLNELYIESDSIRSKTDCLFHNLNIVAEHYQYLDSNLKFKEKIERDINSKLNYLYQKDSFLNQVDTQNIISVEFKNNSKKDLYIIIDRDVKLKNNLVHIPALTTDTIHFLDIERFKILLNHADSKSKISFDNLGYNEASKLKNLYAFKGNSKGTYFHLTKFKTLIVATFSDNIMEINVENYSK